jgi:hypothetical protein
MNFLTKDITNLSISIIVLSSRRNGHTHTLRMYLTLKEKRRLRVYDNTVVRKIFGFKRNEVTENW